MLPIKFTLNIWLTTLMMLLASQLAWSAPAYMEQILPSSGGNSVAISGEWGFVGDTDECQVFIYKYDWVLHLWGDGGVTNGSFTNPGTPIASTPYAVLRTTGSCATAQYGGFGATVSTSNGLVAVGAPDAKGQGTGSIRYGRIFFYVYDELELNNGVGGWVQKLSVGEPLDRTIVVDEPGDVILDRQENSDFGRVVSIRYNTTKDTALLVAGAPLYDVTALDQSILTDAGKAYLFEYKVFDDDIQIVRAVEGANAGDNFGAAVTSNGEQFLVSAPNYDILAAPNDNSGAVFLWDYEFILNESNVPTVATITLAQSINSGEPPIYVLPDTAPGADLGVALSLGPGKEGVMLISSKFDSYALYRDLNNTDCPQSIGCFTAQDLVHFQGTGNGTAGGDVSQSDNATGFGFIGTRVDTFADAQNLGDPDNPPAPVDPDLELTRLSGATEADYGHDISVAENRVMVNGNLSEQAYAYYPGCAGARSINGFEWTMIGLPCDTGEASIDALFGGIDKLGTYGTNWVMWKQNGVNYTGNSAVYAEMLPGEPMQQGVGYWIIADGDAMLEIDAEISSDLDIPAITPAIADPRGRPKIAAVHELDIKALLANWTGTPSNDLRVMLSNPFPVAVNWDQSLIEILGVHELVGNSSEVFFEGDTKAYVYNPATNGFKATSSDTPGFPRDIAAGEAYFVRFNSIDVSFLDFRLAHAQPK